MKVVEKSESKSNFEDRERTQKIISMYWAREKKKSGVCWCACQFACVRYIEQCECWKLAVCLLSNYQFEHQSNFTFFSMIVAWPSNKTCTKEKGWKKQNELFCAWKVWFCFVLCFFLIWEKEKNETKEKENKIYFVLDFLEYDFCYCISCCFVKKKNVWMVWRKQNNRNEFLCTLDD